MLADANASILFHTMMFTTIKCEQIEDGLIHVNGKEVRQDMEGNWIGKTLDIKETRYFNLFLQTLKRMGGGKLQSATYKV